jgi:predicted LPLAT superfamily acyltransferase
VNNRPKWEGRTHGGSLGHKGLLFYFKYLNSPPINFITYPVRALVVVFYMIFSRTGFNAIWFYFRKIHGYSFSKSLLKTYKNHYLFGQALLDRFTLFAGKGNKFRVTISGQEIFTDIINSDKAAIIASSHIGNFEIAGYLLHQTDKKINSIVYQNENPVFQEYRKRALAENNAFQIPIGDDLGHIITINNILSKGEILTIPCDRLYTGNKFKTLNFMGKEARFPVGSYYLAAHFDIPVVTFFVIKEKDHYKIFLNRIDRYPANNLTRNEKVDILVTNYVADLENILRKYPEQWYNYYKFWD